jgi:hypothetical protein
MKLLRTSLVLLLLSAANLASAGPYADALGKKLVSSTSQEEKGICVRWMFTAMALHPDLKEMSSITPAQRDDANRAFANLVTKMLTDTCRIEAKEALKYEGPVAMQSAFQLFGQIAARELFSNPEVLKGLAELEKYSDSKAIQAALTDEPAPAETK